MTNTYIWIIMIIQVVLCLAAGTYYAIWFSLYKDEFPYLDMEDDEEDFMTVLVISLGQWFLIMMNFVPISLIVTLEIIKFWQAIFFAWDVTIYDASKDLPCKVQSSNLNEELGMVGYVFSDKTGTLTCNVMSFKKFTAGQRGYGTSKKSLVDYKSKGITNVNFDDQLAFDEINNKNSANWLAMDRFFRNLAVCHTVIVQEDRLGAMSYNAASPDELALVNGAKLFGYSF